MIQLSERKGTADIQPHSSILKGEKMNNLIVKNNVKSYFNNFIVSAYSSATVWEFVDKVTRMCEGAPQYCDVVLQGGRKIKDTDYGKTLAKMGVKNHDMIIVKLNGYQDEVQDATDTMLTADN